MKTLPVIVRRVGLAGLCLLLLAALAFVSLRSGPLAPVRVTVTRAVQGSLAPALFGIGTVEARHSYLIGPTTAGRVRQVAVDVGERVRAGQLLAEMDPVDLDERLAALEASIARAGSALGAIEAQRLDAQARKVLAVANAQRYVDLGRQDFISSGAVEAGLQEQTSADAALSGASANLAAARQDLQRLGAERAGLRQQRAHVRLLAPADALVIGRDAEPGSTVVAGQAVLRLIDPASLWVRTRFDQGRSAGLVAGLRASIVRRSDPGQALAGRVLRVEAVSDSVTEERIALIAFDALPPGVSVGELTEVTLALPATPRGLLLPNASLQHQGEQVGVWRLENGELQFAALSLGPASLDGQVLALGGLKGGDTVVVHSDKALSAGSRVQVVESLTGRQP